MKRPQPTYYVYALWKHGFGLTRWRYQDFIRRAFGATEEIWRFDFGTVYGLLEFEASAQTLDLCAVHNEKRGNGQFVGMIARLEAIAKELRLTLRVVQFQNMRLADWFGRRHGWHRSRSRALKEYAEFSPT